MSESTVTITCADYAAMIDSHSAKVAALEAELAKLRAGQEPVAFYWQDVGYKNPNRHGPYFGWPTEAALRNVDGGAIPVPLYTTPQPSAVPDVNAQLLEALENTAAWIEQLPVPTVGAAGQLVKIDKAIAAAQEGGKV